MVFTFCIGTVWKILAATTAGGRITCWILVIVSWVWAWAMGSITRRGRLEWVNHHYYYHAILTSDQSIPYPPDCRSVVCGTRARSASWPSEITHFNEIFIRINSLVRKRRMLLNKWLTNMNTWCITQCNVHDLQAVEPGSDAALAQHVLEDGDAVVGLGPSHLGVAAHCAPGAGSPVLVWLFVTLTGPGHYCHCQLGLTHIEHGLAVTSVNLIHLTASDSTHNWSTLFYYLQKLRDVWILTLALHGRAAWPGPCCRHWLCSAASRARRLSVCRGGHWLVQAERPRPSDCDLAVCSAADTHHAGQPAHTGRLSPLPHPSIMARKSVSLAVSK